MVKTIDVDGFDALNAKLAQLSTDGKADNSVLILFCGSNDASGKSWCPDCVTAEPVVHECIERRLATDDDTIFIHCLVGARDYWKNGSNPFRKDERFRLTAVPTLMLYGHTEKRLVEEQLFKRELIDLLLDDL